MRWPRLAMGTYPDGSTPDVTAVDPDDHLPLRRRPGQQPRLRPSAWYLRAGLRTSGRSRAHRNFIEECLRMSKAGEVGLPLARRSTTVASTCAAGTPSCC